MDIVPAVLDRCDHRTGGRVLHDGVHAHHADRVQPELAESVQGELEAARRNVRSPRDEGQGRVQGRRAERPGAGGQHDAVADVPAERTAVPAHAAGRLLERPDPEEGAVHVATVVRRTGPERGPAAVRLLLLSAAHGSGRHCRDHTTGPYRWPNHDDHDCLQLHRRRYHGLYNKGWPYLPRFATVKLLYALSVQYGKISNILSDGRQV